VSPAGHGRRAHGARVRFGERTVLAFLALVLLAVPFAMLVVLVIDKFAGLQDVDQDTANGLHGYAIRHPLFIDAMRALSAVGSSIGWVVILTPVFLWLMVRRLFRLALFLAVTAIGSSLLNAVVKAAVHRARPHLVDPVAVAAGKSFPSGHAQAATVGCGILVLIFLPVLAGQFRRWLFVAAALVVALIGFSRIALGVHYLSDVAGGIVLGAAWLLAMTAAFSAWRREERKPPVRADSGLEPEHRDQLTPGD
jgi:membrane-associated phospholipid phosphatase